MPKKKSNLAEREVRPAPCPRGAKFEGAAENDWQRAPPKRRPNGTVLPGNVLNPTGRPRIVREIQEIARSAAPAAFARVVALANSADERVALAAAQEILNRAHGKPVMSVQSDVRSLDIGKLWVASMEAINKRETEAKAQPVTICEARRFQ